MTEKRFPLMDGPSVPWHVIEPHERQAQRNHQQSLERLAQRGGLSCAEFWFVMNDMEWGRSMPDEAVQIVRDRGRKLAHRLISDSARVDKLVLLLQRAQGIIHAHHEINWSRPFGGLCEVCFPAYREILLDIEAALAEHRTVPKVEEAAHDDHAR